MEKRIGVILAGGMSKRYGKPKAFITYKNVPFYQYAIRAVQPFVSNIIIVTNPHLYPKFQKENGLADIMVDEPAYQGLGPMAGIYSAMKAKKAEWYIVLPCDMPLIDSKIIQTLLNYLPSKKLAIVPVVKEKAQPQVAIYHHSLHPTLMNRLQSSNRSLSSFLENMEAEYVPMENSLAFSNINEPKDYETLLGGEHSHASQ
jgi:molybdenum cofactor guanylyltransferase